MNDGTRTVMIAGLDDALARRVVVLLSSLGVHFRRLSWEVVLAEPASVLEPEVVIVAYQGDRSVLAWLVELEGWSPEGGRCGAVVVLCPGDLVAEVRQLLDRRIAYLISLEDVDLRLRDAVSSLLDVAPRFRIRAPVRLDLAVAAGVNAAAGTTENISASGMLVSCPAALPVGSTIRFEIAIPGQVEPIRGSARVVRATDPEREGVRGMGAQFLSFLGPDRDRFDGLLSTQVH